MNAQDHGRLWERCWNRRKLDHQLWISEANRCDMDFFRFFRMYLRLALWFCWGLKKCKQQMWEEGKDWVEKPNCEQNDSMCAPHVRPSFAAMVLALTPAGPCKHSCKNKKQNHKGCPSMCIQTFGIVQKHPLFSFAYLHTEHCNTAEETMIRYQTQTAHTSAHACTQYNTLHLHDVTL